MFAFMSSALPMPVAVLPGCATPATPASKEAGVESCDLAADAASTPRKLIDLVLAATDARK